MRLKTRKPSLPVRKTEDLQYISILAAIVASFRRIFQCNQRDQIITIIPWALEAEEKTLA